MISIEDKLAIQDVIARFAHYSDYGDWDNLAGLYTDDVVTEMDGMPVQYQGIEEQIAHAKESDEQTNGKNRHYNFNMWIEAGSNADEAIAHYMFANVNAGDKPMTGQIVVSGRMWDTLKRTADGWKIARRRVGFDQDFLMTS